MPLKILIADEDEAWAKKLKAHLEEVSYKVDLAYNGKEAQLNVYNNEYFAVILNPSIKNHSGLQVLTYISKNMENQRVFILLEDESLLQTQELSEEALNKKGVNDILVKPILNQELTSLLESYQSLNDIVSNLKKNKGVSQEEEVRDSDTKFTQVQIDKFYPSQAVLLMSLSKLMIIAMLKYYTLEILFHRKGSINIKMKKILITFIFDTKIEESIFNTQIF